ncbi:alkaline phosphatase, tissue-nonspecific isozyme [Anabrus simplex]|uniref:alkaline phosphatase, tissue-nonspecific isozyme n=1 Tax=Anabrus simplex TaxID=316456 RepID=UPI0034DD7238
MRLAVYLTLCCCAAALQEDKQYWFNAADRELASALKWKLNEGLAKNVIVFIGDGMGPNSVTAARIYKGNGNEQEKLTFDEFPHIGMLKTYCSDKQVPDSASTATALLCGVKTNYRVAGVDANVKRHDCEASLNPKFWTQSILQWAQEAGKDTGFVTTTRVTHATPSALYAHSPERSWECEATMPPEASHCKDIARQLIEDEPGKSIKVIMGGGRQCLVSNSTGTSTDPIDTWACSSEDGRDLIRTWKEDKISRKFVSQVVQTSEELENVDVEKTDYLLGIFANGHLPYEHDRNKGPNGPPSLQNMTSTAIKILQKNPKGYVLVVEGGLIDVAHHRGLARHALNEIKEMDAAVRVAVDSTGVQSDTLIIVTSDHTHTLSISGYPERGASIVGLAGNSKIDKIPYTSLNYATGDMYAFKYTINEKNKVVRQNPLQEDYTSFEYHQQAAILTDEALHGGGDVAVYAIGPMAHLFQSTHEQTYVAHVVGYAAKIGPYSYKNHHNQGACSHMSLLLYVILIIINIF